MFELSFSDAFLLGWGLVATMYAFKFKDEKEKAEFAMNRILDDDNLREKVVADFKEWKKKQIELRFGE
jgi:hypothetical protein